MADGEQMNNAAGRQEIDLSVARGVLAAQPFNGLIGAELVCFGAKHVQIELPIRPDLLQQNDLVHGGVLAYLADNALTFAGGAALGSAVLTAQMSIHYVRRAVGQRLVAKARVESRSSRQAVCRCEVFAVSDNQETLCAVAQGAISVSKAGRA